MFYEQVSKFLSFDFQYSIFQLINHFVELCFLVFYVSIVIQENTILLSVPFEEFVTTSSRHKNRNPLSHDF